MPSEFQLARHQASAYESFTHVFMDGSARLLVRDAEIGVGDVVLDLACGTGLVAGYAIERTAPSGRVVGADINPAMLEVARRRSPAGVELVEAPSDALPFDDDTFTHVICQQGVQFFAEPAAAMREAQRVLRPGCALIATVWATPGPNPYIETQLELLAEVDPSVGASVRRATPANADEFLRATARQAGFDTIDIDLLEHVVGIRDFGSWFLAQTGGTPWGPVLAKIDDTGRDELVATMVERMKPYAGTDGRHRIPFRSHRLCARSAVLPTAVRTAP